MFSIIFDNYTELLEVQYIDMNIKLGWKWLHKSVGIRTLKHCHGNLWLHIELCNICQHAFMEEKIYTEQIYEGKLADGGDNVWASQVF